VQQALSISIPSARVGLLTIAAAVVVMIFGSLLFPDRRRDPQPEKASRKGEF
jgi:hypothetical protein